MNIKLSDDKPIVVRVQQINDVPDAGMLWIKEMAKYLVDKSLPLKSEGSNLSGKV